MALKPQLERVGLSIVIGKDYQFLYFGSRKSSGAAAIDLNDYVYLYRLPKPITR